MTDLNLGDMTAYERMLYGNVEDDPDLEAELLAIQNEIGEDDDDDASSYPSTKNIASSSSRRPQPSATATAVRKPNPMEDIDRLTRQISQEIIVDDDENDESVDDDPDLLAELTSMVSGNEDFMPPTRGKGIQNQSGGGGGENIRDLIVLIEDRLTNYKSAQKAAKDAGDAAKLRRLERGVETLQEQLSHARSGKIIDRSEIPPPVTVATIPKTDKSVSTPSLPQLPTRPAPSKPILPPINPESHSIINAMVEEKTSPPPAKAVETKLPKDSTHQLLFQRRDEFRKAAMESKQNGRKEEALEYFKTCKQFDKVIEAYENGQEVDLTGMPTLSSVQVQMRQPSAAPPPISLPQKIEEIDESAFDEKTTQAAFKAPPPPSTVSEALQQRLEKYKTSAEQAQQEGNASKARRMGRIQKQYEDAIKAHRMGRPIDFDELPTPPGFAPIPVGGPSAAAAGGGQRASMPGGGLPPGGGGQRASMAAERPHPMSGGLAAPPTAGQGQRRPSPSGAHGASSAPPAKMSKQEQELQFLATRQQQFKMAALAAKKRGDLPTAKHLLKQALGFDQMIDACKNGLRIDIASAPIPPQLKTASATTKPAIAMTAATSLAMETSAKSLANEGDILAKAGYEDVFSTLEQDLINQIQICDRNREFFLNTGDVTKVTEFEKSSNASKKDLAALRNCFKHGDPPPRFHYETRIFPSIKCYPELGTDDLELSIVRGLQMKLPSGYEPKDAEIYVKYDLLYPKETPQTGKTARIKGTNSPTFDFTTTLRINPKSRQFLHMLKRIGIKFEIMQKGGFLRSDVCLGTAEVKLVTLETQPLIHQSLDVIENRKPIGGKLEVKIRIREPLVQKQAEEVREKWLIIDQFTIPASASSLAASRQAASEAFGSRQLGGVRVKKDL